MMALLALYFSPKGNLWIDIPFGIALAIGFGGWLYQWARTGKRPKGFRDG